MKQEVELFGLGLSGKSVNVTRQRLINAYYEMSPEKDRTIKAIYGTPGLALFADRGDTPWRGLHVVGDLLYGVHRGTFVEINQAGAMTSRGTLSTTSGRVDIDDNGTEIGVVDGTAGYVFNNTTPATPITAIADPDFPNGVSTICFQGGRLLVAGNNTGRFYGSGAYGATLWDGSDFATAESNPDALVRAVNVNGTVGLMGATTIETWQNIGGSGFPYSRVLGRDLNVGLAARWSVAPFRGSIAFLARSQEGQAFIGLYAGDQVQPLSPPELDFLINGYSSISDATAYSYLLGGHPMYEINFPSADKSWLFDASTNYWSELRSGTGRHRAAFGVRFGNNTIVADRDNGKLYKLDASIYNDNGEPIITELYSRHIFDANLRYRLDWLELNGEVGAADVGLDPQIGLSLSKDNGHTFGAEILRSWGKMGEYIKRAIWRQLGAARDVVVRVRYSAATKRVFTTAVMKKSRGNS